MLKYNSYNNNGSYTNMSIMISKIRKKMRIDFN